MKPSKKLKTVFNGTANNSNISDYGPQLATDTTFFML